MLKQPHARPLRWNRLTVGCAAVVVMVSAGGVVSPAWSAEPFMPNGITKPTRRAEMSFAAQGLVKEVLVKPGEAVKVGQPVVQLDDAVERKELERLEIEARSELQTKAAEADLAQKRVILTRKKQIQDSGGMNEAEVEDAQLEVTIGEIRVKLAIEESSKKRAEVEVQKKKLEKMTLVSQIAGTVEKIESDPGEVADPSKPAIVVVDNSKIDVEAPLPTLQANKLKPGDTVEVRYEDESELRSAKITYLAPTADAASATRLVRAEMLNPEGKPSGMSVAVKVSEKTQAAIAK